MADINRRTRGRCSLADLFGALKFQIKNLTDAHCHPEALIPLFCTRLDETEPYLRGKADQLLVKLKIACLHPVADEIPPKQIQRETVQTKL